MAYTGKKLEPKLYDVYTKEEADATTSTLNTAIGTKVATADIQTLVETYSPPTTLSSLGLDNHDLVTVDATGKLTADTRLAVSNGTASITMGQWDASTNRVEFVNRPLKFAGYYANSDIIFSNNSDVEKMRIDSSGRITMPYQPTFDAAITTSNGTSGDIVFGKTYVNVGGHYSTSNGRFTAPIAGYYEFATTAIKNNINSTVTRMYLKVNGSQIYDNRHLRLDLNQPYGDNGFMFWTVYLNAGDYVNVTCGAGSVYNGSSEYTLFRGKLLG